MGGTRDGILGTDPPARQATGDPLDVFGAGDAPGPLGIDDRPEPPSVINPAPLPLVARIIAKVTKDWEPPNPRTTPEIIVRGATLEKVGAELDRLDEWGEGGGEILTDEVAVGTSTNLTINAHANLVYRLPKWEGYDKASAAAKAEWDKMFGKLRAHEDRHVAIAVEEANKLAAALIGHDIDDIPKMVTAANKRMAQRQQKLDTDTANGSKLGVPYGGVFLDTTIP